MKAGLTAFSITIIILSCTNKSAYLYALKDYSDELKPHLEKIITNGIVGYDSSTLYIQQHATDKELETLSHSEHPVLRMIALKIMQERDSLDQFGFIMSHLDDAATVPVDEGEFGINFRRIPDVLLRPFKYIDVENEKMVIEEVLLKHNDLSFAYVMSSRLKPDERYYQSIKDMIQRDRPYEEIDHAVYALAKFKKPEDIQLIESILLKNKFDLGRYSFMLMEKYPNNIYFDILDTYARTYFSRYLDYYPGETPAIEFFDAVASYRQKESADLLPVLLNRISRSGCHADTNYLKLSLYKSFLKNKCEAYSSILPAIELNLEKVINEYRKQGTIH